MGIPSLGSALWDELSFGYGVDFQGIRGLSFDDPAGYPTAGCILFRLDLRSLRASEGPITIVSVQEGLNLAKRASGGGRRK